MKVVKTIPSVEELKQFSREMLDGEHLICKASGNLLQFNVYEVDGQGGYGHVALFQELKNSTLFVKQLEIEKWINEKNDNPLLDPVNHDISTLLKEIQRGRPAVGQRLIQTWIDDLKKPGTYTISSVDEIVIGEDECPLPLDVIPDRMGINLVSVDDISWKKQEDGQLINLTIHFIPNNN